MALTRLWRPSPHHSGRSGSVRLIVLHTTEGSTTIESLANWFANPAAKVSSHVGADNHRQGTIAEYVEAGPRGVGARQLQLRVDLHRDVYPGRCSERLVPRLLAIGAGLAPRQHRRMGGRGGQGLRHPDRQAVGQPGHRQRPGPVRPRRCPAQGPHRPRPGLPVGLHHRQGHRGQATRQRWRHRATGHRHRAQDDRGLLRPAAQQPPRRRAHLAGADAEPRVDHRRGPGLRPRLRAGVPQLPG